MSLCNVIQRMVFVHFLSFPVLFQLYYLLLNASYLGSGDDDVVTKVQSQVCAIYVSARVVASWFSFLSIL